ncbi:MAG: molecular chaperone [Enterobacter ludwigii]|nr:molecular chaperone [Enterobacter ludwigii]
MNNKRLEFISHVRGQGEKLNLYIILSFVMISGILAGIPVRSSAETEGYSLPGNGGADNSVKSVLDSSGSQSENNIIRVPLKKADGTPLNDDENKKNLSSGLTFYPMLINYSQKNSKGGVLVNVVNPSSTAYLLQGTVSPFDPMTGRAGAEVKARYAPPFVILPPLARIEAKGSAALRVRQIGSGLPLDRESAAVVSVLAVPPEGTVKDAKEGKENGITQVQIAVRMNMLLFWRPEGVADPAPGQVAKALTFRAKEDRLEVRNPTPYFVHFSSLRVGGVSIPESARSAWIPPMSTHTFPVTRAVTTPLVWTLSGEKDEHRTEL